MSHFQNFGGRVRMLSKNTLNKIDKAILIEVNHNYLVFKSDNECRTLFLKVDKIMNKEKFEIGKEYRLEHINGRAKVLML